MSQETWVLPAKIRDRIADRLRQLTESGELLKSEQLDRAYRTFKENFGPEVLAAMDGRQLLEKMHALGTRDSLIYWLEFKDDDEFPAKFGSIAGGSALKYGLYRRKETGAWTVGNPREQREIGEEEAIVIARRHRDQFLAGVNVLQAFTPGAGDAEYADLQGRMENAAPDVAESSWGHKYFSLLFPDLLDDFHNPDFQRFHLRKLLQLPPAGKGRYLCAGRFRSLALQQGMPINHLTSIFNHIHGRPYRYWRIGTSDNSGTPRNRWQPMLEGGYAAVGWNELGDLSWLSSTASAKATLKERYAALFPTTPQQVGRKSQELFNFCVNVANGDVVLACDGGTVLGIGKVNGEYVFDPSAPFVHHRAVEWIDVREWKLPDPEGLLTTVSELSKAENIVGIERRLLDDADERVPPPPIIRPDVVHLPRKAPVFGGRIGEIQRVLERKRQLILYGPPGTGKTFWAERAARDLAAGHAFGRKYDELKPAERATVDGAKGEPGLVRMCSFHPAFGYEEFIEGWRPVGSPSGGVPSFELRPGLFRRMCVDAGKQPDSRYYLIIDEINRGDIPRIFGELLTLLEPSKRGREVELPLSREAFSVPENLYVIGTMNTADRSIALLDTALRRRFGFVELMPDPSVLVGTTIRGVPIGAWLDALNRQIRKSLGPDGRNLQIGHSYFLDGKGRPVADLTAFKQVLREDVLPLLAEYFYGDFSKLETVLGAQFVDRDGYCFRDELFADDDKLIQAVNALDPTISTSRAAVEAETGDAVSTDGEVDQDETPVPNGSGDA